MASLTPPPTHSQTPFERKQKIARLISYGVLFTIAGFLVVGVVSGSLDHISLSTPMAYLLSVAAFAFMTFIGFMDEPLTVPARLQLRLYAGAVAGGLVFAWVFTRLVDIRWSVFVSLTVISALIKAIAAQMIKYQRAQRK